MTDYDLHTEETHNPTDGFWKRLKVGDTVLGREVVGEAKDSPCGWPRLTDLMSDEGTSWKVCRAGFAHPSCGCPHEEGVALWNWGVDEEAETDEELLREQDFVTRGEEMLGDEE